MAKLFFEWDERKNRENQRKHGVPFEFAQHAFNDPKRIIAEDLDHSTKGETRYYCFAQLGPGIITIRFTYKSDKIRIFGAGYWRKGKKTYEEQSKIH